MPSPPTKANPTANRFIAVPVTGLTNVRQVGVGAAHACALSTVGRVWCWGDNSHGQVGATPWLAGSSVFAPLDITPPNVVAAGLSVGLNHNCLWTSGGQLYCWGDGSKGQLGLGQNVWSVATPTIVSTSPGFGIVSVGTGDATTCVQFNNSFIDFRVAAFKLFSYSCTGSNSSGEFANRSYVSTNRLTAVAKMSFTPRIILGGWMHACRLDPSTGLATCAGRNWEGQLGDGTNTASTAMVNVAGTYSRLTTGSVHTCGYDTSRAEYRCWGQDFQGQLGDGQTTNANTPRTVTGLKVAESAASIGAGGLSTCAIVDDGPQVRRVYCWGGNDFGQLGNGTKGGSSAKPGMVRGL